MAHYKVYELSRGHQLRQSWPTHNTCIIIVWWIRLNLSSGIHCCIRQQWCLLWCFRCVRVSVCDVGPDLVCVMEACLILVICVNCGIWNLGVYHVLHISGACNVCPSCVLWLDSSPTLVMSISMWGCWFQGYFASHGIWNCVFFFNRHA